MSMLLWQQFQTVTNGKAKLWVFSQTIAYKIFEGAGCGSSRAESKNK